VAHRTASVLDECQIDHAQLRMTSDQLHAATRGLRYGAVRLILDWATVFGVPDATMVPPASPAPGPIGDVDVDVLEVVLAGAADADPVGRVRVLRVAGTGGGVEAGEVHA